MGPDITRVLSYHPPMPRTIHVDELPDIARGCSVLGAGGGGEAYTATSMAIQVIEDHRPVELVSYDDLPLYATVAVRILDLIERLRAERGLGTLLISHDLGVVARLCPTTVVLYRGEVVESGATERLLLRPRHPYTAALRRSVPEFGVPFRVPLLPSAAADGIDPQAGCRFGPRCAFAAAGPCAGSQELAVLPDGATVRCARRDELGPIDPLANPLEPTAS